MKDLDLNSLIKTRTFKDDTLFKEMFSGKENKDEDEDEYNHDCIKHHKHFNTDKGMKKKLRSYFVKPLLSEYTNEVPHDDFRIEPEPMDIDMQDG